MNTEWLKIGFGWLQENWQNVAIVATLLVTCLAYIHSRRSDKKRIRSLLARKQAQYAALDDHFYTNGLDITTSNSINMQKRALAAEIEELKRQL